MTACELCKKIIAEKMIENEKTRLNGKPIPESIKRDVKRRRKK